ncbi:MAG: DNA topoisomerase IV subunit B, partial [Clostridia bacterium]|nr:DNA topoisomerase IV subunit B [Clostridia bacterium]
AILTLIDKRKTDDNLNPAKEEFCYDGGIADLVKFMNESKELVHQDVVYIQEKQSNFELEFAVQYNTGYSETIISYVNNIQTPEGGTHETGLKSAYTRLLNEYARNRGLIKEKDTNLMGEDFREGITAVLSIKMQNVQFEGQTKTKLGNPEAKNLVEGIIYNKLESYFAEKKHFETGDLIISKALGAAKAREASKKAKDLARQKNSAASNNLVGKLSPCTGKKAEINELFIVEGDSAGGSAKQGRDRSVQAILPLKGKPINAEKKRIEQLLANEEICTIISALGTSFDGDFDIKSLKYHKIIILADADQDGGHIRSLILTFFYRYMKELITDGYVYIGMPPLYKLEKKDVIKYAYNDDELELCVKELGKNYKLQRYKGLGEMNPEQLWDTTMNPATRTLMRVSVEDGASAERLISTLMGDNIEARKQYISNHANFNKIDDFVKRGN